MKKASNRSSVNSLMGETPSKYNKKNRLRPKLPTSDEDQFISNLV